MPQALIASSGTRVKKLNYALLRQRLTQNVWQTVVEINKPGDLVGVFVFQEDVTETIELKISIDNIVLDNSAACTGSTPYYVYKSATANSITFTTTAYNFGLYDIVGFKTSLKIEVTKTTDAGNNPTRVGVLYQTPE